MKLTVQNLLAVWPIISKLANQPLKVHVALKVGRLAAKMEPEVKAAEESRLSLIKKHGEQNGEVFQVLPANIEAFIAEVTPLMETELSIPGLDPLPVGCLEDATLKGAEAALLESLNLIVP